MTEVSCLSQDLCSLCEGHLNNVQNIFRYLQKNISKNLGRMALDKSCEPTDEQVLEGITRELDNWKDF